MSDSKLQQARRVAAARYPESLTDSMGRAHPNKPHAAILAGHWDRGELVQGALRALGDD